MKNCTSASDLQESIYDVKTPDRIVDLRDSIVKQRIREIIEDKKYRILDVGCGDGSLIQPFCVSQDCYGVDISEVQLEKAQAKGIRTFHLNLETDSFPFSDDFFDLVICSETIEHLLDADNLLHEINRVLRFNGTFILTFPNVNQPISWLIQVMFDLPPVYSARSKSPHVRDYTLRVIRSMLADFGFEISNMAGTYVYPFKGRLSQSLAKNLPRLAEKIVVVSRRSRKTSIMQSKKVVWNVLELVRKKDRGK